MRSFVLLVIACAMSGCRAPMPTLDPFSAGPRRIPPPPTGSYGTPGAPDAYYQPSTVPPASQPLPNNNLSPVPGSLGERKVRTDNAGGSVTVIGSRISSESQVIPATANQPVGTGVDSSVDSTPETYSVLAEPAVRVVEPANSFVSKNTSVSNGTQFKKPPRSSSSENAIEVTRLPKNKPAFKSSRSANTQFISRSTSPNGQFSYDKDYKQLKGQLEYSEAEDRWKLRYIPLDVTEKEIDQYGGSVILGNSPELKGFRSGDFVVVHGRLGKDQPETIEYSATYDVEKIVRVP